MNPILNKIGMEEALCQLAEEASELAQAALKYRRSTMCVNPTPVSPAKAYADLMEEFADVFLCMKIVGYDVDSVALTMSRKEHRWLKRLEEFR